MMPAMERPSRPLPAAALLSAALALAACGPESSTTSGGGTDSATSGSGSSGGSGSTGSVSASGSAGSTGPGSTGQSFINTDTGNTTGPMPPQPNGSQCSLPEECESGKCFMVPMLGGVCSECVSDTDCPMGTCAFDVSLGYAVCSDGGLGAMCDTPGQQGGCQDGLVCAELLDTMGFFPANFCSECAADTDCDGGKLCNPSFDPMGLGGYKACVDPGSVPNDQGCDAAGSGDQACMSGFCSEADIMGFLKIGICGECDPDTNMGCMQGQTCNPPMADMNGLTGATCG